MQHPEPDTISQASQGSIKFAVKVSALARVLIITASIGGFGAGLYGLPALFLLLLGLETGLSFVLGEVRSPEVGHHRPEATFPAVLRERPVCPPRNCE